MRAGAVAILSAMENADAALVMATADATGRTNREKIIKAIGWLMAEKCKAQREPF
jgi:DNA alkylation repair enzyme